MGVCLVNSWGGKWRNVTKKSLFFWECDSGHIGHPMKKSGKAATQLAFIIHIHSSYVFFLSLFILKCK